MEVGYKKGMSEVLALLECDNHGHRLCLCKCDCGKEFIKRADHITRNSGFNSCGCMIGKKYKEIHEKTEPQTIDEYSMKVCCGNPKCDEFIIVGRTLSALDIIGRAEKQGWKGNRDTLRLICNKCIKGRWN